MATEIYVSDFERTEALESYLEGHTIGLIEEMLPDNDQNYELKIRVRESSHRMALRRPTFECRIQLKLRHRPVIHVRTENPDFYQAVHEASLTLKKILRKKHSFYSQHHRHETSPAA